MVRIKSFPGDACHDIIVFKANMNIWHIGIVDNLTQNIIVYTLID